MNKGEAWVENPWRYRRDRIVAGIGSIATSPVIGIAAIVSRVVDGPGQFFRQERVGKAGKPFTMYKIRSMPGVTENNVSSGANDARASRFGRFLRRTGIDELPQLWNIARGEMSFVGPRALLSDAIREMQEQLPADTYDNWYARYQLAPPGIFSTYNNSTHGSERVAETACAERAALDLEDLKNASPVNDIKLVLNGVSAAIKAGFGLNRHMQERTS
jgi:lipopolysaccharide/colanic/teichoic acid biosynthesis glycosyltransferase